MRVSSFEAAILRQIDSVNQCMVNGWDLYLSQLRMGDEISIGYWIRLEKMVDTIDSIIRGDEEMTSHMCSVLIAAKDMLDMLERSVDDQEMYFDNINKLITDLTGKLVRIDRSEEIPINRKCRDSIVDALDGLEEYAISSGESASTIRSNRRILDEYGILLDHAMDVAGERIDTLTASI